MCRWLLISPLICVFFLSLPLALSISFANIVYTHFSFVFNGTVVLRLRECFRNRHEMWTKYKYWCNWVDEWSTMIITFDLWHAFSAFQYFDGFNKRLNVNRLNNAISTTADHRSMYIKCNEVMNGDKNERKKKCETTTKRNRLSCKIITSILLDDWILAPISLPLFNVISWKRMAQFWKVSTAQIE